MKFEKICYVGKAPYTDRTPMRNSWEPGEEKLVSERDAKALLRYLEFQRVAPAEVQPAASGGDAGKAPDAAAAALAQAQQALTEQQLREKATETQVEATLLEVSHMTKGALADFAKAHYGVVLDMKNKADELRNQVTALVQGGLS